MLDIESLSFSYQNNRLLNHLNLFLEAGTIGTLIGASGSGKTSLFRLIAGLLKPQKGSISIANCPHPQASSYVTYMMQEDLLLPWRNVIGNILLTAELGRGCCQKSPLYCNKESMRLQALNLLQDIEMAEYENYYPEQLSGGMRQRVALARSLLLKRPLLLLDEPFGALDVSLREQMYALLRRIQIKHGITILMVTHDFRDALSLSDKIFLLKKGEITQEWDVPGTIRHDPESMGKLQAELCENMRD